MLEEGSSVPVEEEDYIKGFDLIIFLIIILLIIFVIYILS